MTGTDCRDRHRRRGNPSSATHCRHEPVRSQSPCRSVAADIDTRPRSISIVATPDPHSRTRHRSREVCRRPTPPECLPASAFAPKIPIGLELYSVRNELKKDLMATVEGVAKMGYQCVEF